MLSPSEYDHLTDQISALYARLDQSIIEDMARRIARTGMVTDATRHQAERLQQAGLLYEDILTEIARSSDASEAMLRGLFEDAGVRCIRNDTRFYHAAGLEGIVKMSDAALQTLNAGYVKCQGNLQNLTLTTALTTQQAYLDACDLAYMQVSTGTMDYQTAIRRAVQAAAEDGSSVLYPSGHKDQLDVAIRRSVLTGFGQTARQLSLINANDMGCDLMEITAHAGARPSHAEWQGKVVSLSGRKGYLSPSDIGYGTGDGFGGWNCRHDWYPFFEGISQRAYTEERLKELNKRHIEIDGKLYTDYEVSQMQRALERDIRKQKRVIAGFNAAAEAADSEELAKALRDSFAAASVKLKESEKELQDFLKQTGFLHDSSRVWVNGFGRSVSQKAVWAAKRSTKEKVLTNTKNQSILKQRIASGDITIVINTSVQNRHYQDTNEYRSFCATGVTKSYFLIPLSELQEILSSKAGTGSVRIDKAGVITEVFDCGREIAFDTKLKRNTSYVKVFYSKKKTHLTPYSPNTSS